jgi:hypothetical protein
MTTADTTTICTSGWINIETGETGNNTPDQNPIPNTLWHRFIHWPERYLYRRKRKQEAMVAKAEAMRKRASEIAAMWKYWGTVEGSYVYSGGLFTDGITRVKTQWSIYVNHTLKRARTNDHHELDYNALTTSSKVVML